MENVVDFNELKRGKEETVEEARVEQEPTTMTDEQMQEAQEKAHREMLKQQATQSFSQHIGGLTESAHSSSLAALLIDKGIITGEELTTKIKSIVSESLVKFRKEIEDAKATMDQNIQDPTMAANALIMYDELLVLIDNFVSKMFTDLDNQK